MSDADSIDERRLINDDDLKFVQTLAPGDHREVVVCSLAAHRRADRLGAGDPVPALELLRLDGEGSVQLGVPSEKPIVLFFGSYT